MSQYFDKDFLKFLLAFVIIIVISCSLLLATKLYESIPETATARVSK